MSNIVMTAMVEQVGHEEAEPTAYGFNPGGWVALAMILVFAVMAWKKVHKAIGGALDDKIAQIKNQLDEAQSLRWDAEQLMAEYEAKAKSADQERKAMIQRAHKEADEIVAKADADAAALIDRRTKMAEQKIAAEERAAIEQLRSAAADAATRAAAKLIAERNDASSDKRMVSDAIREIAKG